MVLHVARYSFILHLLFKASQFKLPLAVWVVLCSCENTGANATVEHRGLILRRNRAAEPTDKIGVEMFWLLTQHCLN